MFAEFLQNSDRFIATDKEADAVVVPALRVQLDRFADTDEELVSFFVIPSRCMRMLPA